MHSATLRYDEALVNRAVRSYWRRSLGISVFFGVPLLCFFLALRIADGDRSWYVGILAGAALLGIGMPILVYWVHYRNSMAKFRDMKEPVATFVADEDSFTLASDHGSSTLKWEAIKEVWGFEGFWLLLFSKAHFATIPLDGVSDDMRSYVLERVERSGGGVVVQLVGPHGHTAAGCRCAAYAACRWPPTLGIIMTHHSDLSPATQQPRGPLLSIGVALSLFIFVATYFTYFFRHQLHAPGSYLPLTIGTTVFFSFIAWLTYRGLSSQSAAVRIAKAIGSAVAATIAFLFLFFLLVLNTIGS